MLDRVDDWLRTAVSAARLMRSLVGQSDAGPPPPQDGGVDGLVRSKLVYAEVLIISTSLEHAHSERYQWYRPDSIDWFDLPDPAGQASIVWVVGECVPTRVQYRTTDGEVVNLPNAKKAFTVPEHSPCTLKLQVHFAPFPTEIR